MAVCTLSLPTEYVFPDDACGKMNREWADKNKAAQSKLKKDSFVDGIHEYIELRKCLMQEMLLCNTIY